MTITVKFFASLRERLGREEARIEFAGPASVLDVWQRVTGETALPPNTLTAVNQQYVRASSQVADGDEVAFFPPVTGG
jgi:sulfur-carrier protein